MRPTDKTKNHVISAYVEPARKRGERTVKLRVGNVMKELGWTNRTPSVFSTLVSEEFQRQGGIRLVEKSGGPASGGPSTTWNLVYRILDAPSSTDDKPEPPTPFGVLMNLYGVLGDMFREEGGAEAFIRAQRADFGFGPSEIDPAEETSA